MASHHFQVLTNLAYAVIAGVVLAALLYAWDTSTDLNVTTSTADDKKTKTYAVTGETKGGGRR